MGVALAGVSPACVRGSHDGAGAERGSVLVRSQAPADGRVPGAAAVAGRSGAGLDPRHAAAQRPNTRARLPVCLNPPIRRQNRTHQHRLAG